MPWKKMGLIYKADGRYEWCKSHTALPFALHLIDNIYRIYIGCRNSENKTQPGYIEVEIADDYEIRLLRVSPRPVLRLGSPASFDGAAIWPGSIVKVDNKLYMYYGGWIRGAEAPYHAVGIGLATSVDGGLTFTRFSRGPIMTVSPYDPYGLGTPFVMRETDFWRMWYFSTIDYRIVEGRPLYYYHIKYAESRDGIHWERRGVAVGFKYPSESRISRPSVLYEDGVYKMWFSYAIGLGGYRIGYAESRDGIHWERIDGSEGLDVSESGWDSEMVAYPFVFKHKGVKIMLYSGNGYGRGGIGYAVYEEG